MRRDCCRAEQVRSHTNRLEIERNYSSSAQLVFINAQVNFALLAPENEQLVEKSGPFE